MEKEPESAPYLAILANNLGSALLLYDRIDDVAIATLVELGGSEKASLRLNVARVFEKHARGEEAKGALLGLLGDPEPGVREFAARAWLGMPGSDLEPLLRVYERETNPALARTMASIARRLVNRWDE
jgi:hypothetical protein